MKDIIQIMYYLIFIINYGINSFHFQKGKPGKTQKMKIPGVQNFEILKKKTTIEKPKKSKIHPYELSPAIAEVTT